MSLDAASGDDGALALAVGMYVLGDTSLGKAAEHAGMSRWEFEGVLEEAGIAVSQGPEDEADLADEVETALDLE